MRDLTRGAFAVACLVFALDAAASDPGILPFESRQPIGTMRFTWTDSSRIDPEISPESARSVVVQLWYPARRERRQRAAPYVMELDALRADLASRLKLGDPDLVARVATHAGLGAALPGGTGRLPVILFSHGFGTPRAMYTSFVRNLAAAGYFVAAIDHPGMGVVVLDDRLVTPYRVWTQTPRDIAQRSEEERDQHLLPQRLYLSADQRFVLDELERLDEVDSRFKGRLDLQRVAMIGHSRGFLSATCASDTRIKACVNLNGVAALAERREGLEIPLLTIRAPRGDASALQVAIYDAMRASAFDVLVEGSHHSSVSDRDLLSPQVRTVAERRLRVINATVVAFLDQMLRNRPDELLRVTSHFPELVVTVHGQ